MGSDCSEPHVQATLLAVRSAIAAMLNGGWKPPGPCAVGFD
jgi:pyruvate kinase